MKIVTVVSLVLLVTAQAATALAQTTWHKHAANPVLDVGPPGAWDDTRVDPDQVVFENGVYRLWYTGWDGTPNQNFEIGSATSVDGINWTREPTNPVLAGDAGTWDSLGVTHPAVIKDGVLYKMWYSGSDGFVRGIGYAESSDGVHWIKYSGNPVLQQGSSGSWDSWGAMWCAVVQDVGQYKLWYSGGMFYPPSSIGYATSSDGINWNKYGANPVLQPGTAGSWDDVSVWFPEVRKDGTTFQMWYSGYDGSTGRIGYASSQDGMMWEKYQCNPVLDIGATGEWDAQSVSTGAVVIMGGRWKMWYSGAEAGTSGVHRAGYAVDADCTADLDADGDVDMGDFSQFQQQFTGPR